MLIRARFKCNGFDPRPVNWPINHPYWITGYDLDDKATVVDYEDSEDEILSNWPDAINIDSEEVQEYTFTSRFPKPSWFKD